MSSRKQNSVPGGGATGHKCREEEAEAAAPPTPESLVRDGFLAFCSSLGASPVDVLNHLISTQADFILDPALHRTWSCGLCGRASIHLTGTRLREMRKLKGGVGAQAKAREGWLTLPLMAKKVSEELGEPVSIGGLSEMERDLKRPGRGVEDAYEKICGGIEEERR